MAYGFKIMVSGDYALFTRPEMKVERVSYDVPTPSAIEGMLKAVYWKPAIRYVVDKIIVFNPIVFTNIRRNEVNEKVSYQKVRSQMNKKGGEPVLYTKEMINQRTAMVLKNVKYGIEFHFELTGLKSDKEDECEEKHYNIILRRLKNGQCFRQPCLGTREFSVRDMALVDEFDFSQISDELMGEKDFGYMLYGLRYKDRINGDWNTAVFSDNADAVYYRPIMKDGVIDVKKYREVIRC